MRSIKSANTFGRLYRIRAIQGQLKKAIAMALVEGADDIERARNFLSAGRLVEAEALIQAKCRSKQPKAEAGEWQLERSRLLLYTGRFRECIEAAMKTFQVSSIPTTRMTSL